MLRGRMMGRQTCAKDAEQLAAVERFTILLHHNSPRRNFSIRRSPMRHDSAILVRVGFFSAYAANTEASPTNKLGISWLWQSGLSTEVFGSRPIFTVPTQWL